LNDYEIIKFLSNFFDYNGAGYMKTFKFSLFVIVFMIFVSCEENNVEPVSSPTEEESFLDGRWRGASSNEQESMTLSANLDKNFSSVYGTGNVKYNRIDDLSNINEEFTGSITGTINKSQISFQVDNPQTDDFVVYNGGLDKIDSTKFIGNCSFYYATEEKYYTIPMTLIKEAP
jgi:hypothetical protein